MTYTHPIATTPHRSEKDLNMGTKIAVAALGMYVIAAWAAVGIASYTWLTGSEDSVRTDVVASTCMAECTGRLPDVVLAASN